MMPLEESSKGVEVGGRKGGTGAAKGGEEGGCVGGLVIC